jgi:hypothetical protein
MFALAISTGFIYAHVVALELTIRHKNNSAIAVNKSTTLIAMAAAGNKVARVTLH